MDQDQHWGETFEGICEQKAQYELAVCTWNPEIGLCPGLHQKQQGQQVKGFDCTPLLCPQGTPLEHASGSGSPSARSFVGMSPEEDH